MGPSPQESAREEMMAVLKANGSASDYEKALTKFVAAGGSSDDSLAKVGASVYGLSLAPPEPPAKKGKAPPAAIVPFDFMKQFMKDTLVAYGVPEAEAETRRGPHRGGPPRIDSHGIGRLKPIYCDRMDQGILFPTSPSTSCASRRRRRWSTATSPRPLRRPYCMKLAIEKAKKHGVGFVVAQNSTHYGIAGYYATMASDAGCVGLTGTNAALGKCALTPVGGAGDDMGGYKGYGWATTVELLCTAFQSGPFGEAVCGIDRATGAKKPMPWATSSSPSTSRRSAPRHLRAQLHGLDAPRLAQVALAGGRIWTAGELEHDARARHAQGGLSVPYPPRRT
ncbi:oxidoreductase [Aureococcus anophagefferens]|nr:oxidoreductase [Aureococcus anophagefferens]